MNLIFRVLYVLIRSLFAAPMTDVTVHQRLTLRVLPTDLDTNWHMNNGRYLTMMDLGRLDFILRSRLLQLMLREKSVPVLAAATIRYRRMWNSWADYIAEWTRRPNFRTALPRLMRGEDPAFVAYMAQISHLDLKP